MAEQSRHYKTKPCRFFPHGLCKKGDKCPYIHDKYPPSALQIPGSRSGGANFYPPFYPPAPAPSPPSAAPRNPPRSYKFKTKPCKFFKVGLCNRGDGCTYQHPGDLHLDELSRVLQQLNFTSGSGAQAPPPALSPHSPHSPHSLSRQAAENSRGLDDRLDPRIDPRGYPESRHSYDNPRDVGRDGREFLAVSEYRSGGGNNNNNLNNNPNNGPASADLRALQERRGMAAAAGIAGIAAIAAAAAAGGRGAVLPYKYKILPCKFFAENACKKGALCTYRHGDDDIYGIAAEALRAADGGNAMSPSANAGASLGAGLDHHHRGSSDSKTVEDPYGLLPDSGFGSLGYRFSSSLGPFYSHLQDDDDGEEN